MKPRRTQRGVVLVFSLIMLLVMTVIGVAALRENQIQTMMAANTQYQTIAFNAGEDQLAQVEQNVKSVVKDLCLTKDTYTLNQLQSQIPEIVGCWQILPTVNSSCDRSCAPGAAEFVDVYRIQIKQSSLFRGEQRTLRSLVMLKIRPPIDD